MAIPLGLRALSARPALSRTRDFGRTSLGPRHRLVVRGFAEALFSHEVVIPAKRLDAFVDDIDHFISPASKTLRAGLLMMLDAIRWTPFLLIGRFSLFEDLSIGERVRMLEKMEASTFTPFTLMFVAYKTIMVMVFFEDEAEQRSIGYPGAARERHKHGPS